MKKLLFLALFAFTTAAIGYAQASADYYGEGFRIQYPKTWKMEDKNGGQYLKISSEADVALFQVEMAAASGHTAMELLDEWIAKSGYTPAETREKYALAQKDYLMHGAESGAKGLFTIQEGGVALFMEYHVLLFGDNAYFLIATTTQNAAATIQIMEQITSSFELMD